MVSQRWEVRLHEPEHQCSPCRTDGEILLFSFFYSVSSLKTSAAVKTHWCFSSVRMVIVDYCCFKDNIAASNPQETTPGPFGLLGFG